MKLTNKSLGQKKVEILRQRFNAYTLPFISGIKEHDRNIILKQKHTHRVCTEILYIADQLGLDDSEKAFCEIIALFHDIGRFEQYKRFKTFVDNQSIDHAEFGCDIIEKENFLDILTKYDQELIKKTVRYHNRKTIPENETKDCIFYTSLLRDADKLDIWYVVSSYYDNNKQNKTIELGLPDTPGISDNVYKSLMNQSIVSKDDLQNLNDFKMLQMGWVYDLNFQPSFIRLSQKGYLAKIKEALPKKNKQIEQIYKTILAYLRSRS